MSRKVDQDVIKQAEKDARPTRLEPNTKGLEDYISRVENYIKNNPGERVLALVFCAGHGYCVNGFQCLAANAYNANDNFYEMVNFEQKFRQSAEENPSAYYLCNFACCREILTDQKRFLSSLEPREQEISLKPEEEGKKQRSGAKKKTILLTTCNFCFIYGTKQGNGILADSDFARDIINLYHDEADIIGNYFDVPLVYNQVKPTDCNLEVSVSNLAQQLRIYRTNDVVGPKVLFYAFDSRRNEAMAETRRLFTEFAKKHLGFSDEEIVMID